MKRINKIKRQLKNAWRSYTIWFNSVGLLLLTTAVNEPMLVEYMGEHGLILVVITGNLILRFKTTQGLDDKHVSPT